MSQVRAKVRISGIVQGVSFRYYTSRTAQGLNLTGWVRNLATGDVEAVFEGPRHDVQSMIDWCHQGPAAARVDSVETQWSEFLDEFPDFTIRR